MLPQLPDLQGLFLLGHQPLQHELAAVPAKGSVMRVVPVPHQELHFLEGSQAGLAQGQPAVLREQLEVLEVVLPDGVHQVVHQDGGGHRAQGEHSHVLPHRGPVVEGALGVHEEDGQLLAAPADQYGLGPEVDARGVPVHAAPPVEATAPWGLAGGGQPRHQVPQHLVQQEGLAGPHGPGHTDDAGRPLGHTGVLKHLLEALQVQLEGVAVALLFSEHLEQEQE